MRTPATAVNSKGNPRILIVGNAGQLGRELEKIFAGIRLRRLVSIANPSILPIPRKPASSYAAPRPT